MAKINLLPWREELRQERQRHFYMSLGGTALVAGALLLGVIMLFNGWIEGQEDRNSYLQAEIRALDRKIVQIEELESTREHLLSRKNVVEELQANRNLMVHLFDQLVRTVPEGLRLTSVQQRGPRLTINGLTQSSARVSTYLRNLESSHLFRNPDLSIVEAEGQDTDPDARYRFRVVVQVRPPELGDEYDDEYDDELDYDDDEV